MLKTCAMCSKPEAGASPKTCTLANSPAPNTTKLHGQNVWIHFCDIYFRVGAVEDETFPDLFHLVAGHCASDFCASGLAERCHRSTCAKRNAAPAYSRACTAHR